MAARAESSVSNLEFTHNKVCRQKMIIGVPGVVDAVIIYVMTEAALTGLS